MRSLERQYRLMYRLGLTPWDAGPPPAMLIELTDGQRRLGPGTALDLGCGTGRHAARLAALGWSVLAVDASPLAIARAKDRSAAVEWLVADLRALAISPRLLHLAGTVNLIVDIGCLHGLDPAGRKAWAACVATAAAPGAVAVVSAATPGRRPGLPRGISPQEIAGLLGPSWTQQPYGTGGHVFHHGRPVDGP